MSNNFINKLVNDFFGIAKILGPYIAISWALKLLANLRTVFLEKNLQSVDIAMGYGPFTIKMPNKVEFIVFGRQVFSGIREMYVRDTYLRSGLLTIEDGDVVVDLGANMGNFTNLALAHGKNVKVISVEPSLEMNNSFSESVGRNYGFLDRATLIRAFIGQIGVKQELAIADVAYAGADYITEDDLIQKTKISKIDFLKCDIEGGEYGLLNENSLILSITRKIAIEIHQFAGNVTEFINMLTSQGFEIKHIQIDPDGTSTVLGVRS